MIMINIHEAKTHLSRYLKELKTGQTIIICKHNVPIAEIRGLDQQPTTPRPIGQAKGEFVIPQTFDDPLPDDLLDSFRGEDG